MKSLYEKGYLDDTAKEFLIYNLIWWNPWLKDDFKGKSLDEQWVLWKIEIEEKRENERRRQGRRF